MKCLACRHAEMVRTQRDHEIVYRDHRRVIEGVAGLYCPSCGESILADDEWERLHSAQNEFRLYVDAQLESVALGEPSPGTEDAVRLETYRELIRAYRTKHHLT